MQKEESVKINPVSVIMTIKAFIEKTSFLNFKKVPPKYNKKTKSL